MISFYRITKLGVIFITVITICSIQTLGVPVRKECLHDLSHPFDDNTIYWISVKPFRFTKMITSNENGYFYSSNEFEAGEHGGTHIDAPYHFNKNGWKVSDIPLERLISVDGALINAKEEAIQNSSYALSVDKLIAWESAHGKIISPTVILIDFGWAKRYPDKNKYFGSEKLTVEDLNFPGISKEAADWIVQHEKVVGVGLDTPSVDSGKQSTNPVAHIALNGGNKFMLENVALDGVKIPENDFKLYISPMKIKEGTGAPCRIFAVTSDCQQ
ncbi:kynurenine formamidase-like [Lycorma delicatula]|uniref:kynurenine formamidase-like n=1 Tax=Lycorma delicatula TaxID=130591 RepID=UPI003F514DAF